MLAYRKVQFVHLELENVPPFEKKRHFLFFGVAFSGTKNRLDQLSLIKTVWEFRTWRTHPVYVEGPKTLLKQKTQ